MPHDAAKEMNIEEAPPCATLRSIRLAGFRCFKFLDYEPGPRLSFITGPNARGKTSLLEAACVLLRLRSPRTSNNSEMIGFGGSAFALEGLVQGVLGETRLSLKSTPPARALELDGVPQTTTADYLAQGRIVWFGSDDLMLVNGPAERRRKLLDSVGLQTIGSYRSYGRDLRDYDRALRSRNLLLRESRSRREIEAYDHPLAETGDRILGFRRDLVASLAPLAADSCRSISGEILEICYEPGSTVPMTQALLSSRDEELRLRQTRVGPQRDDILILLNGIPAGSYASEGQRRTIALSLKLAVAALLTRENGRPPLLLLDDIFGELDPSRRDALLAGMPAGAQALLSTAELTGIVIPEGSRIHRFTEGGTLEMVVSGDSGSAS
jgi:DNA replication and repair protein RecF